MPVEKIVISYRVEKCGQVSRFSTGYASVIFPDFPRLCAIYPQNFSLLLLLLKNIYYASLTLLIHGCILFFLPAEKSTPA